jgi:hypothetical protein
LASTTSGRLFRKIRKLKEVEEMSGRIWEYLKRLIPWKKIREDWLTLDSTVLEYYGKQEGPREGTTLRRRTWEP